MLIQLKEKKQARTPESTLESEGVERAGRDFKVMMPGFEPLLQPVSCVNGNLFVMGMLMTVFVGRLNICK